MPSFYQIINNINISGTVGSTQVGTGLSNLIGTGISTSLGLGTTYNTNPSYSTYTNPLLTSGMSKIKPLDELDIGVGRYGNRAGTPCSPIPPNWGLDSYTGIDGVNPAFMHQNRPLSRMGLELDSKLTTFYLSFIILIIHFIIFLYRDMTSK